MPHPYPASMAGDVHAIYRHLRATNPTFSASRVLQWAKHEAHCDAVVAEIEWREVDHDWSAYGNGGGPVMIGTLADGVAIAVFTDDEPYDWGDVEPTEDERESLQVIGVETRTSEGDVAHQRWYDGLGNSGFGEVTLWGIGFDDRTENAERVAISYAIECGMIDSARREEAERAYWSARDVETIS